MSVDFKFAKLGFINKPWPLINRVRAGEIPYSDIMALSERNLAVQMQRGFLTLKEAWTITEFIDGARGACKMRLLRRGSAKIDSTAKYVICFIKPFFTYKLPLDQYKRIETVTTSGRKAVSVENAAIVPHAFKTIDEFLAGNNGIMWPYIDFGTGEFGVTFEDEADGILFSAMMDVQAQGGEDG